MRGLAIALGVVVVAGLLPGVGLAATSVGNPYQEEHPFALGQPVDLKVEVGGVVVDVVTVVPKDEVRADAASRIEVQVVGSNPSGSKANVTVVVLLEDANGNGLDQGRLRIDPFKVKSGKQFDEKRVFSAPGATIQNAAKVYIFIEVAQ